MASNVIAIDRGSPDHRAALNTFLWNVAAARELGFSPTTEMHLIEHLVRKEVTVGYYSNMGGGVLAIVASNAPDLFDDADFEAAAFALTRLRRRFRKKSSHRDMCADDIGILKATTPDKEG